MEIKLVDASNSIMGRLASHIAKRLLKGESIVVVNAEEVMISGSRKNRVDEAKSFLEVGSPRWGPRHHRRPDNMLRRTIRGMLPIDTSKGKVAYRRLQVHVGVPEELKGKPVERIDDAQATGLRGPHVKLGEIAKELGWRSG